MSSGKPGRPTKGRELYLAKDPFLKALQDACTLTHDAASLNRTDRARQAEDGFFRVAVALETFLTDWLVRCLHFDTSRLASAARKELEAHLSTQAKGGIWSPKNKVHARVLEHYVPTNLQIAVAVPKSVAISRARELLGVGESSRSFKSAGEFKEWAGRYLADQKSKVTTKLSVEDDAVIDATIAARNLLAHRSAIAQSRLREVLASGDVPTTLKSQTITAASIGKYLIAEQNDQPRYRIYFDRLAGIANTLAPYRGRPRTICP